MFSSEWKHPNTRGELRRVYVMYVCLNFRGILLIDLSKDARDPKLKLRFHGTRRACQMGTDSVEPCDNVSCCLCSILKNGFSLARASK